jgi:hypothetical protein
MASVSDERCVSLAPWFGDTVSLLTRRRLARPVAVLQTLKSLSTSGPPLRGYTALRPLLVVFFVCLVVSPGV